MPCICAVVSLVRINAFEVLSISTMEAGSIVLGFSPIFNCALPKFTQIKKKDKNPIFLNIVLNIMGVSYLYAVKLLHDQLTDTQNVVNGSENVVKRDNAVSCRKIWGLSDF